MNQPADIAIDADALKYLACVLDAYFRWRRTGDHLGVPEWGRVLGIPSPNENRRVVDLSDDEFTHVDRVYASLPLRHQEIIAKEYDDTGSTLQKARAMGYGGPNAGAVIAQYRRDLDRVQVSLYELLMPDIEAWESSKPMRRKA